MLCSVSHLIFPVLDVIPCIPLHLLSSCTFLAFFVKPPCPTSILNIVLYPSHWQPPLTVPRQKRKPPSTIHYICNTRNKHEVLRLEETVSDLTLLWSFHTKLPQESATACDGVLSPLSSNVVSFKQSLPVRAV